MLAGFTRSGGFAMVLSLNAHEPGHTGRNNNVDEASAKEGKEFKRLPRLSLAPELDEVVRSVGATAEKATRDPRLHNAFESLVGGFVR